MTETTPAQCAMPYPWQNQYWQRLNQQIDGRNLPHALMLVGPFGIGKFQLARALAERLLCTDPTMGLACNRCKSCQLNHAQTHPDLKVVTPEEGKQLKIDQIRELQGFFSNTAQQGGKKLVILGPAESLNVNAANALLKSLEEPSDGTHLLLFSHQMSGVLATIRSRCQLLKLPMPETELATQWLSELAQEAAPELLQIAGGAPVLARSMLDGDELSKRQELISMLQQVGLGQASPVAVAAKLARADLALTCQLLLDQIEVWVVEKMTAQPQSYGQSHGLFGLRDKVLNLSSGLRRGANPNQQLMLETLLLDLSLLKL